MTKIDPFTVRRLTKFIVTFRDTKGQLPTLQDFAENAFDADTIAAAEADKKIEKFYVTLTNGTIVKGYKVVVP